MEINDKIDIVPSVEYLTYQLQVVISVHMWSTTLLTE